jgi:radical SAM protein with 4Fe4S-binding SPASM domain
MEINTTKIGKGNASEYFINTQINESEINKIFIDNIDYLEKLIKDDNIYEKRLLENLRSKKKLPFPINKHIEFYIEKNKKNLDKIIKYIIFRYKFYLAGKEKINLGYPPYLLVEPVSTCNLRCPFCFQTDKTFTKKPFMGVMKIDLFKKIIDEADILEIGAITLASRGEPTLHKNLNEMLDYIGSKKNILEVKLNTNGTFLNEKICHSIFKNNISQIVISADHYIQEHFEKLRLGSNFKEIVRNVDELFFIRKKCYPESKTEIRVSGIDNDKNLNRSEFEKFWIKRSDHVSAGFPIERWNTYENKKNENLNSPCENLWDRMYIWFDGKVNPCDADYKSYLSAGNFDEFSIKNLWNNKIMEKIRTDHLTNNRIKIIPCDRCGVSH